MKETGYLTNCLSINRSFTLQASIPANSLIISSLKNQNLLVSTQSYVAGRPINLGKNFAFIEMMIMI